ALHDPPSFPTRRSSDLAVVHQREVDEDPVAEASQLQVPVIPPARVLLAEQQHQRDGEDKGPDAAAGVLHALASLGTEAAAFDGRSEEHTSELQSPCNLV